MIPDGVKFCPICGAKQPAAAAPPPPPPPAQYPQYPQNQQYGQYNQYQQNYGVPPAKESPCYVGFGEAIKLYFKNYVNFNGRSTRSEYWYSYLFMFLISMACSLLNMIVPVFSFAAAMVFLLPNLSISFRRFHDTGRKGTMAVVAQVVSFLWSMIGTIGFFILLFSVIAYDSPNSISGTEFLVGILVIGITGLVPLILTIYCIVICCQPSVPEANEYGRAPY